MEDVVKEVCDSPFASQCGNLVRNLQNPNQGTFDSMVLLYNGGMNTVQVAYAVMHKVVPALRDA